MVDKTLSYLDFLKLLNIIVQYSSTPFVHDLIAGIRPLKTCAEITERQEKIDALLEVIKWDGKVPLSDIPDIGDIVRRVFIRDSVLEAQELLLTAGFNRACDDILSFLKRTHNKKPFISELLERIKRLTALHTKISRAINIEGYIEDSASYELSRIRADLFMLRERIRKQLEKIMEKEPVRPIIQDFYISLRNNRYVIPLKPNFNEVLKGIVHDYSHTLKTSFVEPVECVELNNSINILIDEEREEEKRILRDLTESVRESAQDLKGNLAAIQELDFCHSIALFAIEYGCTRPEVTENMGGIDIRNAVNPFIVISKKNETVPVDITMGSDKRVMIISGPNAGGKTAALKTIGLLSVMAKSGLYIPASGTPVIPLFSNIFALIGDEQDITMELSSFTAHMYAIKDLYNHADGDELVLIDEIGGATEPQEASAIAMGVIDAFMEKGCRVVVTTHLNLLKAYGYTRFFAINVATAFDMDSSKPLYKLLYGTAGYSNAIHVAKNIGVPSKIIEKSYEYLGKQEYMLNSLISSLETEKKNMVEERKELTGLKEEFKKRLSLLKEKREEYIQKVEEKCRSRLSEMEIEIEEIKKEVAKKERASITRSKGKLKNLRKRFLREEIPEEEKIAIGDFVKVKTLGSSGYVIDEDREGESCEVVIGNVRTKIKKVYLHKITPEGRPPQINPIQIDVQKIEAPQLNIMGLRVEEALKELDIFIDRAMVQGVPSVKIVHGIGTGRLMQAVRSHLSDAGYSKKVRGDEKNAGVTIVELI